MYAYSLVWRIVAEALAITVVGLGIGITAGATGVPLAGHIGWRIGWIGRGLGDQGGVFYAIDGRRQGMVLGGGIRSGAVGGGSAANGRLADDWPGGSGRLAGAGGMCLSKGGTSGRKYAPSWEHWAVLALVCWER